ncbi:MAG: glycosyltransferase family 2 protein [Deltaproteobacteria bacterium]|nr:glycosyltransferase family 2 protein [Deltaproteobacteria bacterium]
MSTSTYIIVLNWNGVDDTIECIQSLKKMTYRDYAILLVDNASTDGSVAVLSKKFPEIKIIEAHKNLGFAGGANLGMRHALSAGAQYLILLNNDTVVAPDFAGELVKAAENDKKAGILSSKVYFYDRPGVLWYAGASFNRWLGWGRHRGFGSMDIGQFDRLEPTGRPCGCALLATREFCEKAGLLEEEYFCYCEDMEWGMRAGNLGYATLFVPSSKVWHKVSRSTGGPATAKALYYSVRNTLKCLDTDAPLPFGLRHIRILLVLVISILSLFTMNIPKVLGLKRIFHGVMDYLEGKFGELVE